MKNHANLIELNVLVLEWAFSLTAQNYNSKIHSQKLCSDRLNINYIFITLINITKT